MTRVEELIESVINEITGAEATRVARWWDRMLPHSRAVTLRSFTDATSSTAAALANDLFRHIDDPEWRQLVIDAWIEKSRP